MYKIVYSYDPEGRQYTGPVELGESDMSPLESGVWHIPGNCTENAPPDVPEGRYAAFLDGAWVLRAIHAPVVAEVADEPAFLPGLARADLIAALETQVQADMDAQARAYRFTDLADAVSFSDDFDSPKFYGQGRAFRKLRGQTWQAVEPLVDALRADESMVVPTLDELRAQLPVLDMLQASADQYSAQVALDAQAAAKAEPVQVEAVEPPVQTEVKAKSRKNKAG